MSSITYGPYDRVHNIPLILITKAMSYKNANYCIDYAA